MFRHPTVRGHIQSQLNAQNFAGTALKEMIGSVRSDRAGLKGLRNQSFLSDLTSVNRDTRRQRGTTSSLVAQNFAGTPTNFGDALGTALRRTKARAKIEGMGDAQIAQQGLKNRIGIAQFSRGREGELINAMSKARNIREGVNVGVADANALDKASKYGMYGSIAGGITGVLSNKEGREGLANIWNSIFNKPTTQPMAGGTELTLPPGLA
jgi:hypothetical protein